MADAPRSATPEIIPVSIEDEMRRSYLDYAMSVIVARALPDVRDGLKPVHRRILYAMKEAGYDWNRPYRKSARIVGDVMGKYHPHGDAAIYDAMVRMAQPFSMRLQLIDGQGNFGSMDGDPPAAMRYTESRLAKATDALLGEIDQDTIDFQPNYDESSREPTVLPARFPNLLVNGAGGIAVGMATNIPPHHLGEVIDACCALIDNPDLEIDDLLNYVTGPDFPTGGVIMGRAGIRAAYQTGRGSLVVRGKVQIEAMAKDREAIVITEIPYQVNKARLVERIAELVREKRIEGVSDLRDESDRHGVRVVIEVKRDSQSDIVLNQIYRHSPLQTTFGVQMLALNGGRPELLSLKQVLSAFLAFREQVITRRTRFDLAKARDRAHVLVGLAIAVANIDAIIELIRRAKDPAEARDALMARPWPVADMGTFIALIDDPGSKVIDGACTLTDAQARAILELRLQRLTGLERERIAGELKEVAAKIEECLAILGSRQRRLEIMRSEFVAIREEFAEPARRTEISEEEPDHDIEDLIQREDMVVTVSHGGYIKRVPLSAYRAQRRGGKGRAGMATRDEDFVSRLFVASTHTPVLFFSSLGMVYKLKVYVLPLGAPQSRGKALINMLPLSPGETISTVMPLPEDEALWSELHVMFATSQGNVRRNLLSDFVNVMANGKIAMKLDDGDRLIGVLPCTEHNDGLLATRAGKCIRFRVNDVRVFQGRSSVGVRGIRLADGDEVISLSILRHAEIDMAVRDDYLRHAAAQRRIEGGGVESGGVEGEDVTEPSRELAPELLADLKANEEFILSVTEKGFGKRSSAYDYRIAGRGGSGIAAMEVTDRTGQVIAAFPVEPGDQVMLVTDKGQLIRCPVADVRIAGRKTQGVTLFSVAADERVVSVSRLSDLRENDGSDQPAAALSSASAPDSALGAENVDTGTLEAGTPAEPETES